MRGISNVSGFLPEGSRSILTYAGSKGRLADTLKPYIPEGCDFVEVFGGGFSLSLRLLREGYIKSARYNDFNPDVVNFWNELKRDPIGLCDAIFEFVKVVTLLDWSSCSLNDLKSYMDISCSKVQASFVYLAQKSSRGVRGTKIILSTVTEPSFDLLGRFIAASGLIQNVDFTCESYENLVVKPSDFLFFDPPYYGETFNKFYSTYESAAFPHFDFYLYVSQLKNPFLMTYDKSTYIESLYSDFIVETYEYRSNLSFNETSELIIRNN